VASCGLTRAQARSASKKALAEASKLSERAFNDLSSTRLHSGFDPDAVLALLSSIGLSRADIADVVAADPLLLRSRVDRLEPRILALRDRVGLSVPQIARFLVLGSWELRNCGDVAPKIQFFVSLYGSFDQFLVVMKRTRTLLATNVDRVIKPNIALLLQCGLSVQDIAQLCSRMTWLLTFSPERVKELVLRAEELGVPRSSGMFKQALATVASTSKENCAARLDFLKRSLGCSKSEVATAVSKKPSIISISDESLLRKIHFFINEVGLDPQSILQRPVLFTFSLEKRLVPRHCVMKALLAKGLLNRNVSFYTLAQIGEETFRLKFVEPHKDSVTGLADAYATARGGSVPP
jgi:mTERF domain-containing protein